MTFAEYCLSKKIEANKFFSEDPFLYTQLEKAFDVLNQESFTQQKKFLINPIRLKYPLATIIEK